MTSVCWHHKVEGSGGFTGWKRDDEMPALEKITGPKM